MKTYRLYNLTLASTVPLSSSLTEGVGTPDLTFTSTTGAPPANDWQQHPPTYVSLDRTDDGQSWVCLYRRPGYDLLRFAGVADFYLWTDHIVGHLLDPACSGEMEILLLGCVLSYWQERQGIRALHAAAVVIEDRAVAFIASNGGGKSSLAAAFMQAGCPLLTDDILPIVRVDQTFMAHPGYPQMRMWPQQAEHFLGQHLDLAPVYPGSPKRRVPVSASGLGTFCDTSKPLACIYQPAPRPDAAGDADIEIVPISPGHTVIELVRNSFVPNLAEAAGLQMQRLPLFAQMARQIPMRQITYPKRWEDLPRVCEAIKEDVAGL